MSRICRVVVGLGLFLALLAQARPVAAQAPKKDDPPAKKDKTDKTDDRETKKAVKLVPAGTLIGKLIKLEEDSFKMEVTVGKYKQIIDIQLNDDVKVRVLGLELEEGGKPKGQKKDPADKDNRLRGIKGAREDLANNQEIQVNVSRLPNRKLIATVVWVLKKADQ
jgi:hypothetical protein